MSAIKDKILHIILVAIIVILVGVSFYFRATRETDTPPGEFLTDLSKFNITRELQQIPEEKPPANAIKVPILVYHSVAPHTAKQSPAQRFYDVAPESLAKQLRYLHDNGFTVIGLNFLDDALQQTILLSSKPVVLTFDDGWESQFQYAYPLLQKYNYTATFFIFSRAIDHEPFLTWDQIKTMDAGGMTIGGHTRTHPYLLDIAANPVALRREIIGGKSVVENRIGHPINLFAYPYGQYNDQIIEIVKEAGYESARSAYKGVYHAPGDIYKLKAIEVSDDFAQFVKDLSE